MTSTRTSPLVSIIVITFNDLAHVLDAIDSALAQSHEPCEVIVVDDGSTDGTQAAIAQRYGARVLYIARVNGGMGAARARGLEAARGKYIQHVDSDDLLLPDKVAHQAAHLENHGELAFAYGRTLCFLDDPGQVWEHHANARAHSGNFLDEIIARGNFVNVIQPLFVREWIDRVGGWDANARVADDYDIMMRLAYNGALGAFIDEPVFLYRQRAAPFDADLENPATWRSIETLARGEIYILRKLEAWLHRDGRPGVDAVRRRIGEAQFSLGWGLFRDGRRWEAARSIFHGLCSNRDRWPHKLLVLIAALLLPGGRLLRVKRRFIRQTS